MVPVGWLIDGGYVGGGTKDEEEEEAEEVNAPRA